jgi:hypothetical protein
VGQDVVSNSRPIANIHVGSNAAGQKWFSKHKQLNEKTYFDYSIFWVDIFDLLAD